MHFLSSGICHRNKQTKVIFWLFVLWGNAVIPKVTCPPLYSHNTFTNKTGTNHQQFPCEILHLIDVYRDGIPMAAVTKKCWAKWSVWRTGLLFQPHAPSGMKIKKHPLQKDVDNILKPKTVELGLLIFLLRSSCWDAEQSSPAYTANLKN